MSADRSKNDEGSLSPARREWEAPAFTELKIGTETKSHRESSTPSVQPPLPEAPAAKLGFSIEWAFPLTSRTEK
jgi:hypothetical protein